MLRILLIDNPYHAEAEATGMILTSAGLLYLAANIKDLDVEIKVVDPTLERLGYAHVAQIIKDFSPNVVGLSAPSYFLFEALTFARITKQTKPDVIVIMGGPHPTFLPEEVFELSDETDALIFGEGETPFREAVSRLLNDFSLEALKGAPSVAVRIGDEIHFSEEARQVKTLDALPMPAYELVDIAKNSARMFTGGDDSIAITTSRGCRNNCEFCPEPVFWKHHWRGFSPLCILEEIETLAKKGFRHFVLEDDDFFTDSDRALAIVEQAKRRNKEFHFYIQASVRTILKNEAKLKAFRKAGVVNCLIGVESHVKRSLKAYRKPQSKEEIIEAANALHENGIGLFASLLFGHEQETLETLRAMERFARMELKADWLAINHLTPVPGSPLFDKALKQDKLLTRDYSRYTFTNPIMKHPTLSQREMQIAVEKAQRTFWKHWFETSRPWDTGFQSWLPKYMRKLLAYQPSKPSRESTEKTVRRWKRQWASQLNAKQSAKNASPTAIVDANRNEEAFKTNPLVLYVHPHGHLNDLVIPAGAIGVMNAVDSPKRGKFAFELNAGDIRDAGILLTDWHWAMGLRGLSRLVRFAKEIKPDLPIVVGGITASKWPKRLFERLGVDYIIQGDAEQAAIALIDSLRKDEREIFIPNIHRPQTDEFHYRKMTTEEFEAVDTITLDWFPSFRRLTDERAQSLAQSRWLFAARGCMYRCETCYGSYASAFENNVLYRSPENLKAQMKRLKEKGGSSLRIFMGHPPKDLFKRYCRHLAKNPTRLPDGVGIYLCTPPDNEDMENLRIAFPNTAITLSAVWPDEWRDKGGLKPSRAEYEKNDWMTASTLSGGRISIELWHCNKISREQLAKRFHSERTKGAKPVIGYVWNMPRPNEVEVKSSLEFDEEQFQRVLTLEEHVSDFQWARLLSPPLARLLRDFGDLDDLQKEPLSHMSTKAHLAAFRDAIEASWKCYQFPMLPGLRYCLIPVSLQNINKHSKENETFWQAIIASGDWKMTDEEGSLLYEKNDPRFPILTQKLASLKADGYALIPQMTNACTPNRAMEEESTLVLGGDALARGGVLSLLLHGGRVSAIFTGKQTNKLSRVSWKRL